MNIITTLLSNLNYPTIFFLMLLESTVVPVPSEFVVTPAAYHAASGSLNVFLIILFATLGADVGASINYFVALYVGRPFVYKFANSRLGHLCLLNQEKVEKSEKYFDEHGVAATLTGRFVPVSGRTGQNALRQIHPVHNDWRWRLAFCSGHSWMVSPRHCARGPVKRQNSRVCRIH